MQVGTGFGNNKLMTIFTIGHSTRPIDEFIELLRENSVETIVDIRTIPGSRHNPQYNREALERSLDRENIGYIHMKSLGGLRKPTKDSPNTAWKTAGFRGYADYMLSESFRNALQELLKFAKKNRVALMCAEALPWRCHRSLIADALTAEGISVEHIMGKEKKQAHKLTLFARIVDGRIFYDKTG